MHLLPGRRSQWEAAPPVSLRHCQRQWPLVAVPSGHPPTCSLQRWTWPVDSLHCARPSLALWVSGIRTKALTSHLYFVAKKKKTRKTGDVSHVLMLPQSTKVERKLFKLAIGQSLQNEGRALFLPIFLYMHWFFFSLAKMKVNLTSGMPENLEFCLNCLDVWGFEKTNNQSIIFLL